MKVTVYLKKCSPEVSNICFRVRDKNVDIKVVSPLEVQDRYWDTDTLSYRRTTAVPAAEQKRLEKPCDFDPFGQTGLSPFGYNMIDPLKSWCWGSILFYPFKISRFS